MSGEQSHDAKELALRDTLASLESVVVAYSGGVDSAYLAYIAGRTLGDRAVAVTADSPSYPERHRQLAIRACDTRSFTPPSSSAPSTARTRRTAATTASTSCTRTSRGSPPRAMRS